MVETDLARQLGVSRQPIREALHRMEAEGWWTCGPARAPSCTCPPTPRWTSLLDGRAARGRDGPARGTGGQPGPGGPAPRDLRRGAGRRPRQGDLGAARWRRTTRSTPKASQAPPYNAVLAELADIVGRRVQWYYRMVAPERGHGSWTEHAEADRRDRGLPIPERAQAAGPRAHRADQDKRTTNSLGQGPLDHKRYGGSGGRHFGSKGGPPPPALSTSSISPRSDMMCTTRPARYSRMIVCDRRRAGYRSCV